MQEEKLKNIVKSILRDNKDSRNSYNSLLFTTWKALGYRVTVDIDDLFEMPSSEAITRIARKLKEDDPTLKGTDKTEEKRQEMEKKYKKDYVNKLKEEYPLTSRYIRA